MNKIDDWKLAQAKTIKKAWLIFWVIVLTPVLLYAILAFLFPQKAQADELWATSGMWSLHPNEDHYHFNQTNYGGGLAWRHENHTWVIGQYDNSINRNSKYFGVINDPWHIWPVKIGYLAGFVSGYTDTPKFAPAVAPVLTYEYGRFGVNVICIPSVVTAVQVKLKLGAW